MDEKKRNDQQPHRSSSTTSTNGGSSKFRAIPSVTTLPSRRERKQRREAISSPSASTAPPREWKGLDHGGILKPLGSSSTNHQEEHAHLPEARQHQNDTRTSIDNEAATGEMIMCSQPGAFAVQGPDHLNGSTHNHSLQSDSDIDIERQHQQGVQTENVLTQDQLRGRVLGCERMQEAPLADVVGVEKRLQKKETESLAIMTKQRSQCFLLVILLAIPLIAVIIATLSAFDPLPSQTQTSTSTMESGTSVYNETLSPTNVTTTPPSTMAPTHQVRLFDWVPLGEMISGNTSQDNFGSAVDLSADGTTLVSGSWFSRNITLPLGENDALDAPVGYSKVYRWNVSADAWVQLGDDFYDPQTPLSNGWDVSLSGNGNRFATGNQGKITWYNSPETNETTPLFGSVIVYQWNESSLVWDQLGLELYNTRVQYFGVKVALSHTGEKVAAAGIKDKTSEAFAWPNCIVFSAWNETITSFTPQTAEEIYDPNFSIWRADFSGDLSLGAMANRYDELRVYEKNQDAWFWSRLNATLPGVPRIRNVAVSADESTVAFSVGGDPDITQGIGHIRVYRKASLEEWVQLGEDIIREDGNFGWAIALSGDGNIVVAGTPGSDQNGRLSGAAYFFMWDTMGTEWTEYASLSGDAYDLFGGGVRLSDDASVAAVTSLNHDGDWEMKGHVYTFSLDETIA